MHITVCIDVLMFRNSLSSGLRRILKGRKQNFTFSSQAIDDNSVYVCGFARTPIGKLGGVLSSQTAPQLGAHVIKSAIQRAGIDKNAIDEAFMGNVVSAGVINF